MPWSLFIFFPDTLCIPAQWAQKIVSISPQMRGRKIEMKKHRQKREKERRHDSEALGSAVLMLTGFSVPLLVALHLLITSAGMSQCEGVQAQKKAKLLKQNSYCRAAGAR
jgi:hypothetical protein